MCLHFQLRAFDLIGKSVGYLEKNLPGPSQVSSRSAWSLARPTRPNSLLMHHSARRLHQRACVREADRTVVARPRRHCSDPAAIVPTDAATLSSRSSLRARYFLLSLAKLSPSLSYSISPLCPLLIVRPRRQLPSMNHIRHHSRAPRSHANQAMTPSHHPREQSLKSSKAGAARHLFHGHLVDDHLIQPPSGLASTSMSFPPSPRSSMNPEPTATTTGRPPHRRSPMAEARRHGQPNPGEPLPNTSNRVPTSPWCSPTLLFTAFGRQPPKLMAAAATSHLG
jgi:hypothetical protein